MYAAAYNTITMIVRAGAYNAGVVAYADVFPSRGHVVPRYQSKHLNIRGREVDLLIATSHESIGIAITMRARSFVRDTRETYSRERRHET